MGAQEKLNELRTLKKSYSDLADNVIPISDLAIEVQKGKESLVDAVKAKGGNSSADKSLSEIADDVRNISNIDKTFSNVDFFMAQYGLSMSPLQLIYKHFDTEYPTYVCYVVDAGTKINVQRSAYVMFTADGAIDNPEGEYIIPEWENRFGYFIFAYKSDAVTWENFDAYFIGMYGATTTLDNRTMSKICGVECDNCNITLGDSCFASRVLDFTLFNNSNVNTNGGGQYYNTTITKISLPQITSIASQMFYQCKAKIISLPNAISFAASQGFCNSSVLKIDLSALKSIGTQTLYLQSTLTELYLPECTSIDGSEALRGLTSLKKLYAPKCKTFLSSGIQGLYNAPNLDDITLGEVSSSIKMSSWSPANLTDEAKAAKIDKTIREGIANRIQDRTDLSALTITFSQAVRDILTTETEEAFAAKNWNIAPAKSV